MWKQMNSSYHITSSVLWSTAAASTKEMGNFWAKPGSCVQTKACVTAEDNQAVEFPLLVLFLLSPFPSLIYATIFSFQHQNLLPCFQFDRIALGTLICSKKSTGKQLPPHHSPGYCEQRPNCQWEPVVSELLEKTLRSFKKRKEKGHLCSCRPAAHHLHPSIIKRRGCMNCTWSHTLRI